MTDEQINVAIATHCGWTDIRDDVWHGANMGVDEHGLRSQIPSYCDDLNAMHEAEKTLTDTNMFVMAHYIERLVSARGQHYFHATARQRAEAFLLTLGKWEEVQG